MLTFTNHATHPPQPFAGYIRSPGYSHSFLRYNINGSMPEIIATDKMRLGTMVDEIRTGGNADITYPQYAYAKQIALYLIKHMPFLDRLQPQAHCTATAHYAGLQLPMKTLIDFLLPGVATVEMKVSDIHSKNVAGIIAHMGYDNQCFIERSCANVPVAYLLIYCRKSKDIYFDARSTNGADDWVSEQVLKFGSV